MDSTPFEDVMTDITDNDTFMLASPVRFYALEDLLANVREAATFEMYHDDYHEMDAMYGEAVSQLIQISNLTEAMLNEITTTYRTRRVV